ncbi:unnamed protein product [Prunus brigantina]
MWLVAFSTWKLFCFVERSEQREREREREREHGPTDRHFLFGFALFSFLFICIFSVIW